MENEPKISELSWEECLSPVPAIDYAPKPSGSHLFHGDHICPNNPQMRRFEMYEVVSKHQALLLLTKVKERVSDLARSGIV